MDNDSQSVFTLFNQTAKLCADEVVTRFKADHPDQKALLNDLETAVRDVAQNQLIAEKVRDVLNSLENELMESPSEWGDLSEVFEKKLAEAATGSLQNSVIVHDYCTHVQNLFERLDLQDMIVSTTDVVLDPYSKKPIADPVKSRHCGHKFDRTSVMKMFESKGSGKLRCPHIGCQMWFTRKDVVDADDESN